MGRILILFAFFGFISPAYSSTASGLNGLAERGGVSGQDVVSFVRSGMNAYPNDPVIKLCFEKLSVDRNAAIYALFNYIMYLDMQDSNAQAYLSNSLSDTRRMIAVSTYAKKSVNYCNS